MGFNIKLKSYFIYLQPVMKEKIKKIGAVLMTLIVLLSTMSFTIHKRYCSGNLVATTLFSQPESCKIEKNETCCVISEPCCEHEQLVIDGQNEMQISNAVSLSLKSQLFVADLLSSNLHNFKIYTPREIVEKEYSPPNLVVDKQVTHQVFII